MEPPIAMILRAGLVLALLGSALVVVAFSDFCDALYSAVSPVRHTT